MAKASAGRTAPRTALGRRLDRAMDLPGYTNARWAEELGVTPGNVSHWRQGRHAPDVETILKIAARAGVSDYTLLTGRADPRVLLERFIAARAQLQTAVAAGEPLPAAWERILGQPELLTDAERLLLDDSAAGLKRYLATADGLEWFRLNEEQQRLVRELLRLFARESGEPAPASAPGPGAPAPPDPAPGPGKRTARERRRFPAIAPDSS